jgi:hypothetical protein
MSNAATSIRHHFHHANPQNLRNPLRELTRPYKNGVYSALIHGVRQRAALYLSTAFSTVCRRNDNDNRPAAVQRIPTVFAITPTATGGR